MSAVFQQTRKVYGGMQSVNNEAGHGDKSHHPRGNIRVGSPRESPVLRIIVQTDSLHPNCQVAQLILAASMVKLMECDL